MSDTKHDIEAKIDKATRVLVSRTSRGGLLVQIGYANPKALDGWEWHSAFLPPRLVKRVVALAEPTR